MFLKFLKIVSVFFIWNRLALLFTIVNLLFSGFLYATIIEVTNNDGSSGLPGSLNSALQTAQDGDIIDCSPIAGQTISLSSALPAIGYSATSTTPTLTILGSGVTIDGSTSHPAFSLAQGSATISDFTIQNGASVGGAGGSGQTGGGGGTGGGGALYVHSGSTMTISTINLNNNQAIGGAGGAGNAVGGSGAGGGGFGGGRGGPGHVSAGSGGGGGGGGNNGGTNGGTCRGAGSPNTFTNFAGAGGGGGMPGIPTAGAGGSNASIPSKSGGAGGTCSVGNAGGGGGGGGSGASGSHGSNAIDATSPGTGMGGQGGLGFGVNDTYGCGGGGGGASGGTGYGTSGGGGALNGPGGVGGTFGGGGGASSSQPGGTHTGGNSGFGAGGGGGNTGGIDIYGIGGAGGSASNAQAGGGGGSGLGGAIYIQQGAALIVQDGVSLSDNSTTAGIGGIASGGSNGGNGSSLGQDIFIQSGGNITFQINNTLTLSTPIEGGGLTSQATVPGIVKSGTGTINLTGVNSYLGDTMIQSGTLSLNGSISGDLYIEPSSTLSGNATANGNIYNNGTISPGNSIGEVFTTDLYLFPTSVYNVEINSAGDSDMITASGLAQIDGSVIVSPDDLNFTTPLTYTIISTNTGVTGEFSSLTSSVPSLMSLMYNPANVQLTYLPLDAIDLTGNALNAANAFITIPALPGSDASTVNNSLLDLSFNDMQTAFEQMSPALFSGPTEIQLLDAILVRSTYTKHLQKFYFYKDQNCGQLISLWIDGFAQWQNQGNQFGYNDTTAGITIGADYSIHDWVLGAAFSSTFDNFYWKYSAGKANINSYYGGLYGRWNHNEFYMNVAILGAFNKYNTMRQINFGTINRHAYSQHNGNEWLAHLGFEYWVHRSQFQWTPYINLDYVMQHEQSYTEIGANSLNLHVNSKNAKLFQGEAGVALSTTYHIAHGELIPMLTLAYINQTPCSSKNYYANFVNSTDVFSGTGGNYERNLFVSRLAFMYQDLCDKVNISIYYDAQINNTYWAQDIVLDLTFHF